MTDSFTSGATKRDWDNVTVGDPPPGTTWGTIEQTVVYPPCPLPMPGTFSHEFAHAHDPERGQTLLYCRHCGLVQRLEVLG